MKTKLDLLQEIRELETRLSEARKTLLAIEAGEIDAGLGSASSEQAPNKAHERMRESERFLEENPNPVVWVSTEGKILYWNAAASTQPGWMMEFGKQLPDSLFAPFKQAVSEARKISRDIELGGRYYSVVLVPAPVEGYVTVYGIDITAHKRAKDEISARAAQLHAIFNAMSDAVLIYDVGMNVERANPSFLSTYGFDPVGLNLREIMRRVSCRHLDGRPLVLEDQPTPRALRGEPVAGACFQITRPDGTDAVVETSSRPMKIGDHIIGSVTVWHDVTRSKAVERALGESELFLTETERIARVGGWMANPFTDYLKWTDGVYEILGASRDYAPGVAEGLQFFLPQYAPVLRNRIETCLATGESFSLECEVRTVEGSTLWTEARGLLAATEGKQSYVLGTLQDISDRKRIEKEIRESEARFKLLSETAGALLCAEDPGEILNGLSRTVMELLDCQVCLEFLWNEEAGRLQLSGCAGVSEEDAFTIERSHQDLALSSRLARNSVPIFAEGLCHVPDSITKLLKSYGIRAYACHPLMTGDRVMGTLAFGTKTRESFSSRDLVLMKTIADQVSTAMERKRLLGEIKKSRDELEGRVRERTGELLTAIETLQEQANLLNLAGDAILVHDLSEKVVYWSRGAEKTYGWSQGEARGTLVHDLLKTEIRGSLEEIKRGLQEKGTWEGELYQTTRDGTTIIVASRQATQLSIHGRPKGVLQINRDITERKRAENEIHQAKTLLQSIFDGISDPLMLVGMDSKVRVLNQAARDYFQVASFGEPIGKTCHALAHGNCLRCAECPIHWAFSTGKTVSFERRGIFDPDRIEQVTAYAVGETVGEISGTIVRIEDITEARSIEQHLTRVDRLTSLGQLAAGIAHEIRNPLAGINLFVDVLADEERFQRTGTELEVLGEIKRSIRKMDAIIKRVLDFARQAEAGVQSKLDVGELIDETLKMWRAAFGRLGIRLTVSVGVSLPPIFGDGIELQQVLNNVLQNAVDAMGHGGSLSVTACEGVSSVDQKRPVVIISIRDNGPGIPEEHRESVFNPFYTTKSTGTGLGLAISHRIVTRHRGAILFESTTGTGATFHIELPIALGD